MNREQIEKAAGEYSGSVLGFKDNPVVMAKHKAFAAGADWRIKSVWHDTREIPKEGEHIVIATASWNFYSWYVAPDIMQVFDKFNVKLWARSSDLLPEGKEETL